MMKQCENCKTFKKADNCRKCAEKANEYERILDAAMNDGRKIEMLEAVRKRYAE